VDISVQGTIDTLELSNTRGTIKVNDVTGHLTLTSLEGRVLVERADGDVFARTLSGSVVLRGVTGRLETQGVAGNVELSDVTARDVTARTYEGGIRVQGALPLNGTIRLSTFTGAISIPTSGPCAQVLPGVTVPQRGIVRGERFDLLLTTTTPAGVARGPVTCTLRRE
jgi:DUF4097 and DUF4098 domain-containing protein YvlB